MNYATRRLGRTSLLAIGLAGVSTLALAQTSAGAPATPADPREARIEQLETEVRALVTEVQELKRGQAEQIQTLSKVESQPLPAASASIALGHPSISSADGQFTANFHTIMQLDAAQYDQDSAGPLASDFRRDGPALGASTSNVDLTHARHLKDGDDFRRARIGVDGTAYGDWDYRLVLDFGGAGTEDAGQVYETWVQYSGLKPLKFRIGAFTPPIGIDDQTAPTNLVFLERSLPTDIARNLAAGDTRTGAEVLANGDHWFASGAVTGRTIGVVNTGTAAAVPQTYSDQLGFVGRLAATPLYGKDWRIHLGVNGSLVARPADATGPSALGTTPITSESVSFSNTPELRVDGTKLINTGSIPAKRADSVGAEFAAQKRNFLLQAEYQHFGVDRSDGLKNPDFHGFYVQGSWVATGEAHPYNAQSASFDAPVVAHPFNLSRRAWGALEVALRYSDMDLNFKPGAPGTLQTGSSIRGGDEQNLSAALNWYPNNVVRFMLDYQHVRIDRLSPATTTAAANTIWFTPVGAEIGQNYDVFELRSQFAF